ncbi:Urmylation protein [Xylographa opegraphella]|nr:Urmylation protein [Xylographa opegraphella]
MNDMIPPPLIRTFTRIILMCDQASAADGIRTQIELLESQLLELKKQLSDLGDIAELRNVEPGTQPGQTFAHRASETHTATERPWPLSSTEYLRYGRQMIMPEIGLQGQLNLRKSSVLIIGVGGLGCPAAQYLAGAGIGTVGLVDGDVVELSNLHRQILHTTERVGQLKVDSAIAGLSQLNPNVHFVAYPNHLAPANAIATMKDYDLILDCTDHPASRYLISDAAVLSGKPLISGSALKTEGQLMMLNNPPSIIHQDAGGPCYRCIFPKPPPIESVISCGDGGIVGPVVGVIGVLMALEAIKLIVSGDRYRPASNQNLTPSMLLYSAYSIPPFRQIRLRGKRPKCTGCSTSGTITKDILNSGSIDYKVMCGILSPLEILKQDERIDVQELKSTLDTSNNPHLLLDVRDETQFGICNIAGSVNVPSSAIEAMTGPYDALQNSDPATTRLAAGLEHLPSNASIYTICRLGNDSQLVVRKLKSLGYGNNGERWIGDVRGGYKSWREKVDPEWPEY